MGYGFFYMIYLTGMVGLYLNIKSSGVTSGDPVTSSHADVTLFSFFFVCVLGVCMPACANQGDRKRKANGRQGLMLPE